jgi:histidinol-phosphate/aromatic aminotransferase/cobyric acid decarboxylase-like protein
VLRTLAKAYALAGARCGSVIADPEVIGLLMRIIPPYAMPSATTEAVEHALAPPQLIVARSRVETLIAERERLASALARCPAVRRVFPSSANFLLAEFRDASRAFERLRSAGLLVRDVRSQPGLGACLRITVGEPQQNSRMLKALEDA